MRWGVVLGLVVFGVLLVGVLVTLWQRPAQPKVEAVRTPSSPQIAAAIPYWDQAAAIASLKAHQDLFDFVSVFWYVLRSDGSLTTYPNAKVDDSLITWAHANDIQVLALIANLPAEDEGGDWDAERVERVISSQEARAQHIADILALVKQHNFDGVNIDYEALPRELRSNFTRFTRELSAALHQEGKVLGVALHPKVGEGNPRYSNGSQAQDWKELARYADHLYLMTYEEHWGSSAPGPAASPEWLMEVLTYAQELIPPDKIYAGIPLYGYDWSDEAPTQGLTYADVQDLIAEHQPQVRWDSAGGSWHFTYTDEEEAHEVWFEDERSVQLKLGLTRQLNLSNVAFWRLGGEDPGVWSVIEKFR